MKKLLVVADYIFLLRPTLFYPIWIFFLAGCWGGMRFDGNAIEFFFFTKRFLTAMCLTLLMGGVFILNQIQDIDTDRANKKLFLLTDGVITIRNAYIESSIFVIISLLLGFWINIRVGFHLVFLFIISGVCYNYPPTLWKNHPIMGLVINGMGAVLIYSLGWTVGGGRELVPMRVIAYIFAGLSVFLNTTLPDIPGDQRTGKITFGVRYGIRKTAYWALIFETCTVVLAFVFQDWLLFIPALIVFPLFVIGALKPVIQTMIQATKFSVLALAVAVCVFFPWFVIPVVVVFFGSKWYYRKRFNFNYPNFKIS